ncbi:MAG: sirohydrochlorin chelatase [Poseidonibacter sp.]
MKAIIFIAHGSKKDKSNNEFKNLVENISKNVKTYELKKAAFLELASPSIEETAIEFIKKGAKDISFYPYFLNSGKHVLIDVPEIIDGLKKEYKDINFTLLNHFGKSKRIEEIILSDIE